MLVSFPTNLNLPLRNERTAPDMRTSLETWEVRWNENKRQWCSHPGGWYSAWAPLSPGGRPPAGRYQPGRDLSGVCWRRRDGRIWLVILVLAQSLKGWTYLRRTMIVTMFATIPPTQTLVSRTPSTEMNTFRNKNHKYFYLNIIRNVFDVGGVLKLVKTIFFNWKIRRGTKDIGAAWWKHFQKINLEKENIFTITKSGHIAWIKDQKYSRHQETL